MKHKAQLTAIDAEPLGGEIIERLEEALEKARAGELSSVAVCVVYRDGSTGNSWSTAPSLALLIASAARLQHRLHLAADDRA